MLNKNSPHETSFVLSRDSSLSSLSSLGSSRFNSSTENLFGPNNTLSDGVPKAIAKKAKQWKKSKKQQKESLPIKNKQQKLPPALYSAEIPKLSPGHGSTTLDDNLNIASIEVPPGSEIPLVTLKLQKAIADLAIDNVNNNKADDYRISFDFERIESPRVESPQSESPQSESPRSDVLQSNLTATSPELTIKYLSRWQSFARTKRESKRRGTVFSKFCNFYKGYIGGSMPELAKTIEANDEGPLYPMTTVDSVLRGAGQVVFMNNAFTGAFILASLVYASPLIGAAGVVGLMTSTFTAMALQLNNGAIRAGLYGYNGLLTGLAIATFYSHISYGWLFAPIIFCSLFSVFLSIALSNLLGPQWDLPCFTLPFNIATAIFIVATVGASHFPRAATPSLAVPVTVAASYAEVTPTGVVLSVVLGVSQVFLAANWITGTLMLVGIAICSPIACGMAVVGSSVGVLTAFVLGASWSEIVFGLWGYNSTLGAMAISVFFVFNFKVFLLAVICSISCALFFALCKVLFTVAALPALTFPFCLAALIFVLVKSAIPGVQPVPLSEADYPEKNIRNFYLKSLVTRILQFKNKNRDHKTSPKLSPALDTPTPSPPTDSTTITIRNNPA